MAGDMHWDGSGKTVIDPGNSYVYSKSRYVIQSFLPSPKSIIHPLIYQKKKKKTWMIFYVPDTVLNPGEQNFLQDVDLKLRELYSKEGEKMVNQTS